MILHLLAPINYGVDKKPSLRHFQKQTDIIWKRRILYISEVCYLKSRNLLYQCSRCRICAILCWNHDNLQLCSITKV